VKTRKKSAELNGDKRSKRRKTRECGSYRMAERGLGARVAADQVFHLDREEIPLKERTGSIIDFSPRPDMGNRSFKDSVLH